VLTDQREHERSKVTMEPAVTNALRSYGPWVVGSSPTRPSGLPL